MSYIEGFYNAITVNSVTKLPFIHTWGVNSVIGDLFIRQVLQIQQVFIAS